MHSLALRFFSAADVQRLLPEHATRPAFDAERAPDQHERPAACEFTSSSRVKSLTTVNPISSFLDS